MKRTKLCGFLSLLLVCWLNTTSVPGQTPGYSGGSYPASTAATPNTSQVPLYATRQSEFAIPFTVDRRIAQPVEVQLYLSVDQGRNWRLQARQPPTTRQFAFRATGDGEYWFASRTLDGAQRGQNQTAPQPELRVVVDTVSPQVEFSARPGEGGAVLTTWQVFDQNLLASSLKIEYQEAVNMPWKPVPLQLPKEDVVRTSYQGQTTWWPETRSATLNIRAEVRDRAGNLGVANRRLLLPALVAQRIPNASAANPSQPDPFSHLRHSSEGAVAWPSDNHPNHPSGLTASGSGSTPPPQQGNSFGSPSIPPPRAGQRAAEPAGPGSSGLRTPEGQLAAQQTSTQFPVPPDAAPPDTMELPHNANAFPEVANGQPPKPGNLPPAGPASEFAVDGHRGVVTPTATPLAPSRDIASMLPPGERPQMTNSPRFHLEYDVDAVGPTGVAEVQLWATADAGHTWRLWGTDDDLQSPFDVAVEEEGIFGFHVVVVGKNGMSGRRPRTGDLADIWVGVDTTVPTADLIAATYGEGAETGKLLIKWRAADENLDPRPITLSFSESQDGPWTIIVSALPNSGHFSWPADPQLPSAVYLKLEVRDLGGNVATDRTDQPIQIDGLAPQARIRGVQPMQDMDREAFRLRSEGGRG